jgi:hypothetical protein
MVPQGLATQGPDRDIGKPFTTEYTEKHRGKSEDLEPQRTRRNAKEGRETVTSGKQNVPTDCADICKSCECA